MTLTDGVKIQNVGSFDPVEYAGIRLLLVHAGSGEKVEQMFVNPAQVVCLRVSAHPQP